MASKRIEQLFAASAAEAEPDAPPALPPVDRPAEVLPTSSDNVPLLHNGDMVKVRDMPAAVESLFNDAVAILREMFIEASTRTNNGRKFYGHTIIDVPWEDGRPQEVQHEKNGRIRPIRGGR